MKKLVFVALLPIFIASKCKKNDPPAEADKYMTLSAASVWNYDLINRPSTAPVTTPFTLTSTTRDTTINGRVYHVFTNSNGNRPEYYHISGSDYYTYRVLDSVFGNTQVEVIYLKDNVALGGSWVQNFNIPYSGVTLPVVLTSTIEEKGISKVVNGVTYTDVIHVKAAYSVTGLPPGATLTNNIHYYFARKYGLILNESASGFSYPLLGISSSSESHTKLKSAVLK